MCMMMPVSAADLELTTKACSSYDVLKSSMHSLQHTYYMGARLRGSHVACLTMVVPGLEDNSTASYQAFVNDYQAAMALTLGASSDRIAIQSVVTPDQSSRRLLQVCPRPPHLGAHLQLCSGAAQAVEPHSSRLLQHLVEHQALVLLHAVNVGPCCSCLQRQICHSVKGSNSHLSSFGSGVQDVMTVATLVYPPYTQSSFADAYLAANKGVASGTVTIGQLAAIDKVGVLGNGICEVGELQDSAAGTILSSCPTEVANLG